MRKYLILIAALLVSCRANNFTGTFSSRNSPYRFTLDSDSTFTFHYKEGLLYSYSFGNWSKVGGKKIKLQSFYKNKIIQLYGNENSSSDFTTNVELKIKTSIPSSDKHNYKCLVFINNKFFIEKTCDSISSIIAPNPIENLWLKITTDERISMRDNDTLVTSEYYPKHNNLKSIDLNCAYNDSLFNFRVFNNHVLNFTNGKFKFMKYKLLKNLKYKP